MSIPYPVASIGTAITVVGAAILLYAGRKFADSHYRDPKLRYRVRNIFTTFVLIASTVAVVILWARLLQRTGTFLGIIGAGLAIALREPLLSVAGRIAIFAGNIYSVGDRIEINKMTGDIIDVGFFYTRMEVGNWISGDQFSGRMVQFANAQIFGAAVFNYTQNFSYIWDEVKLPITYASNNRESTRILLEVGREYTREFLKGAEQDLQAMRHYFVVPQFELDPQVYMKVTSNWLELTMRYVVDPKKRRAATSFIYGKVFAQIQGRDDITIASETMNIGVQQMEPTDSSRPKNKEQEPREEPREPLAGAA